MCGIVGFTGQNNSVPFLKEGLKRLEYRGYDSAGITVLNGNFETEKTTRRIETLETKASHLSGNIGIGHTRWATHGGATIENAHPHLSGNNKFAVVHNGIIENYSEIRKELKNQGFVFKSETDTEVIPHLLQKHYKGDIKEAVFEVLARLKGAFALGIICADFPDMLIAAKSFSPLIIGIGEKENYMASDISAINRKTDKAIYLKDGEIAFLTPETVTLCNQNGEELKQEITIIQKDEADTQKGKFPHFMLKEIYEQPNVLRNIFNHYIKDGEIYIDSLNTDIKKFSRIDIVACGSAYHVGVVAKYIFEELLNLPTNVDIASEYRYRRPVTNSEVLTIAISQSGETADTISAIKEAKSQGSQTLSIVNVEESTLSKTTDDVVYTLAGTEIAVATTKGYTSQLAIIYILALLWAKRLNTVSGERIETIIAELKTLPDKTEEILKNTNQTEQIALSLIKAQSVFFIGRNTDYAVGLEAGLKLKEISYIHAESYAAGELKHGTISLIEKGTPVIALCANQRLKSKTISNIKEVAARGGYIIACAQKGDSAINEQTDKTIFIPETDDLLTPLSEVIPFQLLAYYVALCKKCDIDKPRNLAKSVTVE